MSSRVVTPTTAHPHHRIAAPLQNLLKNGAIAAFMPPEMARRQSRSRANKTGQRINAFEYR
jgi:hypothetical protein